MVYRIFFFLFFVISFTGFSQVTNPSGLEFFEFRSGDYTYKICIAYDEIMEKDTKCTVRVVYNNSTSLVEYYSEMELDFLGDSNMVTVKPVSENAKILKGSNGYNPDTFLLVFDADGVFLKGESTDKNSTQGNPLKIIVPQTASESMALLKEFYNKDDYWYPTYMKMIQEMISSN